MIVRNLGSITTDITVDGKLECGNPHPVDYPGTYTTNFHDYSAIITRVDDSLVLRLVDRDCVVEFHGLKELIPGRYSYSGYTCRPKRAGDSDDSGAGENPES